MLQFQSLTLEGLPLFKNETFDLSQRGVSLVLGKNLAANSASTNGAGKSFFFTQLIELLSLEPLAGPKKDTVRKGSRSVVLKRGKSTYKITQAFSPKETLTVERNGVDLQLSTLDAAREEIRRIVGMNAEELKTLVYLDSRYPHPLIAGDTSQRKKFFTEFFRLEGLSAVRKLVEAKAARLKEDVVRLESVTARLSVVKTERAELSGVREELETATSQVESLRKALDGAQRVQQIKVEYEAHEPRIKKLRSIGAEDQDSALRLRASVSKALKRISEYERAVDTYNEWAKETKAVRVELKGLPEQTQELEDLLKEEEKISEYNRKVHLIRRENSQRREELETLRSTLPKLKASVDVCPTCGGPHRNEDVAEKVKEIKLRIEELETELRINPDRKTADPAKTLQVEKAIAQELTRKKLTARLSAKPELPSEPEGDKESLSTQYELLSICEAAFEASVNYQGLTTKEQELANSIATVQAKFVKWSSECSALQVKADRLDDLEAEYAQLVASKKALKTALLDTEPLQVLAEAMSRKGVEAMLIQSIAKKLEDQVNKYAKYLFSEDFRFSFDLGTQFDITVTRRYATREETSDVRKLSGAESKMFSLVLLISLLTFIPAKNRTNLLVLDEPTAACGPDSISAFIRFLPVLNSVIPHVIVITPLDATEYNLINPTVFTVVKTSKGRATIQKGEV